MAKKVVHEDRVRVWNSFLYLAHRDAKELFEQQHKCTAEDQFNPKGGMLAEDQRLVLSALASCALAIEARANHLIWKLVDQGRLTKKEAEAALWLSAERKWFLLPKLAGRRKSLDPDVPPHIAVKEICRLRNGVVHVHFHKLTASDLPPCADA